MKSIYKLFQRLASVFLLPFSFFFLTACPEPPKDDNTPKRDTTIHLEVLSTFTTTAKLHISVDDTTGSWVLGLIRNGEDILTAIVYNTDTTFTDYNLNPGTQYTYQAQWLEDDLAIDSSLNAVAITMDTTSHNFVWEIDTLGISGSLRDVQIIDENNIWVVGEIEVDDPDSSFNGTGRETFNTAHWNGVEWELILIDRVVNFDAIFAFNENEIWFSDGCFIYLYDGTSFTKKWECDWESYGPGQANAIWGTSSSDLYFVGKEGTIVHYNGTSFTKMTSPTTQDLDGIAGVVDSETGEKRIWVNGWSDYPNRGLLLQYNGTDWEIVWDENNPFFEDSQYVTPTLHVPDENLVVYSGGTDHGIFSIHEQKDLHQYEIIHQNYNGYIRSISGDRINDVFFVGYNANIFHYNGSTIKSFQSILNIDQSNWFMGVDYKDGLIVTVSDMGLILKGYKIE